MTSILDVAQDLEDLGDEDYLVARSRTARKTDPYAAKAWMITAKLMFPKNFAILFEAYCLEQEDGNVAEAAKYFKSMFIDFPKEEKLWVEVEKMVEILQTNMDDQFLAKVFEQLPPDVQQQILLKSAQQTQDKVQYCKLMILLFDRFPPMIPKYGSQLLSSVLQTLKTVVSRGKPPHPLHRLLILDLCTKLLPVTQLKIEVKVLHEIMYLTVEYLFCSFFSGAPSSGNPWKTMFGFLEEIGLRMGWSLTEEIGSSNPEALWQRITSFQQQQMKHDTDSQDQLFFVTVILFLKALSEYSMESHEEDGEETILVEAFVEHLVEERKSAKRRRTTDDERRVPMITHGAERSSNLISGFVCAVRYYDLICSEPVLSTKFKNLNAGGILSSFHADVSLFQGHYREAQQYLRQMASPTTQKGKCRHYLRLGSIAYCTGDYPSAGDHLIHAIEFLSIDANESYDAWYRPMQSLLKQQTVRNRHVHFLSFTRHNIISYVTRMLIKVLRDRGLLATDNDTVLGHVFVLLQYIWPEEEDLYVMLLNSIKKKKTFTYPIFCNYIINVNMLEDFMHFAIDEKQQVVLDITTSPVGTNNQRRVATRGVNRGEKEEIKTAIKKQAVRCYDNMDKIMLEFLSDNKGTIIQALV